MANRGIMDLTSRSVPHGNSSRHECRTTGELGRSVGGANRVQRDAYRAGANQAERDSADKASIVRKGDSPNHDAAARPRRSLRRRNLLEFRLNATIAACFQPVRKQVGNSGAMHFEPLTLREGVAEYFAPITANHSVPSGIRQPKLTQRLAFPHRRELTLTVTK